MRLEKKKYQTKATVLRLNIIPKKIYANFFPINAVSGSSFTLILHPKFLDKSSTFYKKNFLLWINIYLNSKTNNLKNLDGHNL